MTDIVASILGLVAFVASVVVVVCWVKKRRLESGLRDSGSDHVAADASNDTR